jgi:hypothetical protein
MMDNGHIFHIGDIIIYSGNFVDIQNYGIIIDDNAEYYRQCFNAAYRVHWFVNNASAYYEVQFLKEYCWVL